MASMYLETTNHNKCVQTIFAVALISYQHIFNHDFTIRLV